MCMCVWRPEKDIKFTETEVIDSCSSSGTVWELKKDVLQEHMHS